MYHTRFDDIRPYHEHEIADAMQRIAAADIFPALASYVFPDQDPEQIRLMVSKIDSTFDFQDKVMSVFNQQVISRSITDFRVDGIEQLDKDNSYLFVSNHRDIVLDSSLLQYALHIRGYQTTDITFGANLMSSPLIVDIGKSNKMFRVERASSSREFVQQSRHLSDFIYEDIVTQHRSVWIAQRNGRTKNGIDATDPGIIKMFCMCGTDDLQTLTDLNIVPVAVSYEWEPCDLLKAVELYKSRQGSYKKQKGEDLNSILTGIRQPKGRVHFQVCPPLDLKSEPSLQGLVKNAFYREVAAIIDREINSRYQLMPTNYIAHDLRQGTTEHLGTKYSAEQLAEFQWRKQALLGSASTPENYADLRAIFLDIYANPLTNYRSINDK